MTETKRCDAAVVGAGPGGYVAAIRLAQLGRKTVVIEKENVGGVCLNHGCIPSKALLHAAEIAHGCRDQEQLGITVQGVRVDGAQLAAWRRGVVAKLTGGVAKLLKGNGVELLKGEAHLRAAGCLDVTQADGEPLTVLAKDVVLAVGARPISIPGFAPDGQHVLSSRQLLSSEEIPERLLVIGGGYIGLELGTAFRKLGSEVVVVEFMDQLLPTMQADLVRPVAKRLKQLGMQVHIGARARSYRQCDGGLEVLVESAKGELRIETDRILSAVGMRPATDGLGLKALGVDLDEQGFIVTDDSRCTSLPRHYAIGDCAGGLLLAHKASKEGIVASEAIAGMGGVWQNHAVPWGVFTDPEIAGVGLSEAEAKERGFEVRSGRFHFAANGRALAMEQAVGFARVVACARSDRVLGVQLVGPHATELVAEATLAIELRATAEQLARTIHAHPTLPEALMEAAEAVHGRAIHGPPRRGPRRKRRKRG